jgi:uncharacterized protein (DUF1697 family)
MNTYVILLRGINVGGKNKMPMAKLKLFLEEHGCSNVTTYIQSGNVIVQSPLTAKALTQKVEENLPKKFTLDSSLIKVLILTEKQLSSVIEDRPKGFGDYPEKYHSDVIFLIDIDPVQALTVFKPLEGVDTVWPGDTVIYSQRLSAERTKSRLSKIVGTPLYKSMTIRNWNTTVKLLELVKKAVG